MTQKTNVIDLFAGPGGLGEGFAQFPFADARGKFQIALSIEKDPTAAETLLLRSFTRQFPKQSLPPDYYDQIRACTRPWSERWQELKQNFPRQSAVAEAEVWNIELGATDEREVNASFGIVSTSSAIGQEPTRRLGEPSS